jgi:hypothetical protein
MCEVEGLLEDDPDHPIPFVGRIDTMVTTLEKTCYYGLVIASPLGGDSRSRERLLQKLSAYVTDRHSSPTLNEFGPPSSANTKLTVLVHPGSDTSVFELLAQSRPMLEERGFRFEISTDAKALGLH